MGKLARAVHTLLIEDKQIQKDITAGKRSYCVVEGSLDLDIFRPGCDVVFCDPKSSWVVTATLSSVGRVHTTKDGEVVVMRGLRSLASRTGALVTATMIHWENVHGKPVDEYTASQTEEAQILETVCQDYKKEFTVFMDGVARGGKPSQNLGSHLDTGCRGCAQGVSEYYRIKVKKR